MLASRRNVLLLVLFGLLALLQYQLWFKQGGIRDMMKMKQLLAQQEAVNLQLKTQNEALLLQVQRLQKSEDAVESRARHELGMVKKGETFYQIVK